MRCFKLIGGDSAFAGTHRKLSFMTRYEWWRLQSLLQCVVICDWESEVGRHARTASLLCILSLVSAGEGSVPMSSGRSEQPSDFAHGDDSWSRSPHFLIWNSRWSDGGPCVRVPTFCWRSVLKFFFKSYFRDFRWYSFTSLGSSWMSKLDFIIPSSS